MLVRNPSEVARLTVGVILLVFFLAWVLSAVVPSGPVMRFA